MAASQLDICNRALARVDARSDLVSIDEDSTEAFHAGSWYDPLRRALLRSAHWAFARQQVSLTLEWSGTGVYPFLYKYTYPEDCLAVRYILPSNGGLTLALAPRRDCRFLVATDFGSKVIVSNVQNAIAVYTADVTTVGLFDPLFEEAQGLALASKLAAVLKRDYNLSEMLAAKTELLLLKAQAADANEAVPSIDHIPDWIAARGVASMYPDWGMCYAQPLQMGWGA